jgi:hypothetical protein
MHGSSAGVLARSKTWRDARGRCDPPQVSGKKTEWETDQDRERQITDFGLRAGDAKLDGLSTLSVPHTEAGGLY